MRLAFLTILSTVFIVAGADDGFHDSFSTKDCCFLNTLQTSYTQFDFFHRSGLERCARLTKMLEVDLQSSGNWYLTDGPKNTWTGVCVGEIQDIEFGAKGSAAAIDWDCKTYFDRDIGQAGRCSDVAPPPASRRKVKKALVFS